MTGAATLVWNGRLDVLTANELGRAVWSPMFGSSERPVNVARFAFLDAGAPRLYGTGLDAARRGCVVLLRTEAGRRPHDRDLNELVGALATRSDAFRAMWAAHDVGLHQRGTKHLTHPEVGDLELAYEAFGVASEPGSTMTVYTARPGSPSSEKLAVLASWYASEEDRADDRPDGRAGAPRRG